MAVRTQLDARQWSKLARIIEAQRGVGRRGRDDRKFMEAVLWIHRTGAPWRDLPTAFGPWKTVYNRFDRWSRRGRWAAIFAALADDVDGEWHSVDATVNRAHQHSAGGKGGPLRKPLVVLAAVGPRRSTWWSMLSACQWTSKSRWDSATTASPHLS